MEQLLMKWYTEEIKTPALDEGYELHYFTRGGDELWSEEDFRRQWIKIHDPEMGKTYTDWFDVVYYDERVPNDGFFTVKDAENNLVATACIQLGEHTQDSATLHAVAADENHRGKGLGKVVVVEAMKYAYEHGIKVMYLTTDDWRIPAVALYLKLNFIPVCNTDEMHDRWNVLAEKLNVEIKTCTE